MYYLCTYLLPHSRQLDPSCQYSEMKEYWQMRRNEDERNHCFGCGKNCVGWLVSMLCWFSSLKRYNATVIIIMRGRSRRGKRKRWRRRGMILAKKRRKNKAEKRNEERHGTENDLYTRHDMFSKERVDPQSIDADSFFPHFSFG